MRVTANMSAENSLYNIQLSRRRLDNTQELISSGQNINRPSDDPITSRVLLEVGDKVRALDQYSSNISKASSWLKFTSTALDGLSSIVNLAQKVTGSINSGSSDPNLRQSAHDQLVDLKSQLIDMANTQYGDQYIFGGANNSVIPFKNSNADNPPIDNSFAGDGTQLTIEVAQGSFQALNITGDRVLLGTGSSPNYGSTNILDTFDNLIAAIGDRLTPSNVTDISTASQALQDGAKQLIIATSDVLSRTTRLDNMSKLNDNNKNTLLSISTGIQEVDYAKLGIQQNNQQIAFEASLSATAKLTKLSLLDYM
ncbi:MAG: flagellar hook-associated protein FlgL [Desulfuromonadaceae bacterium]|nr:flagellar hook-associated protein FlgL [Desulfuromonadaceae bacterium]MDD2854026.1 flagellar hook-associated protein FlgL [Desulfuromonadaceae bacterium]